MINTRLDAAINLTPHPDTLLHPALHHREREEREGRERGEKGERERERGQWVRGERTERERERDTQIHTVVGGGG